MARSRQELLRQRYEMDTDVNLVFTYLVILLVVVALWDVSDRAGLLRWAAILGLAAPIPHLTRRQAMGHRRWFVSEAFGQFTVGLAWGSITVLALPTPGIEQGLLVGALIGVLVASSAGESQFPALYLAFMTPFAGLAVLGILTGPDGVVTSAVFIVVAFAFSVVSANGHRAMHVGFVDLLLENERLVVELADERDALADANRRLDRMAWSDSLTDLANRAAMDRELEAMLADVGIDRPPAVVAYLDLNGFKPVNDSLGHRVGDLVLIAVARRLEEVVAGDETVYRLGGDEFTVLSRTGEAVDLGARLSRVFDRPIEVDGHRLALGAGIGIATTTTPVPCDDLVRLADLALYRHKRSDDPTHRFEVSVQRVGEAAVPIAREPGRRPQ